MESVIPSVFDVVTFSCALVAIGVFYFIVNSPFDYWKKQGVPQVTVRNSLLGNLSDNFWKSPADIYEKAYYELPQERFIGTYTGLLSRKPTLLLRDPDLVMAILVRDFSIMSTRSETEDPDSSPISKHLLNLGGEHWKIMRNKLTPTFSSGKLKDMHSQLIGCSDSLIKYMEGFKDEHPFEVRDVMARFTMDVIASCAFGLNTDVINEPDSKFRAMGQALLKPSIRFKIVGLLRLLAPWFLPVLRLFSNTAMTSVKFFVNVIDDTLDYRQKNKVVRKDFLHLMNELKMNDIKLVETKLESNNPYIFDHKSVISNAFVFFLAGFETTASTISNVMYELALNPDIQERLSAEVTSVLKKHGGQPTYEAVQEMMYLEQVISETLRKYPPVGFLGRKVVKEYILPGSEVILPAGTVVHVPVYVLHHDPQYYPEPEKFLPERFDAGKNSIRKGTYLPFSTGPRVCIGERFAKLEIKVCLSRIISKYQVLKSDKTAAHLTFDPNSFLLIPKGGIWVAIKPRQVS